MRVAMSGSAERPQVHQLTQQLDTWSLYIAVLCLLSWAEDACSAAAILIKPPR